MPFVTASIIILATGLFDDLQEFSARSKFVGQLSAAVMGVPIMDTVYVMLRVMLRRLIRGMSPFSADRRHVHHTLIYIGLGDAQTSWLLLAVSVLFGAIGFFGWFYGVPEYVLTYGLMVTFAAYCAFMRRWWEIFRFFGIRHRRYVGEPVCAAEALAE